MVTIDREAAPATAVAAVPALVAALAGRRGAALALGALPAAVALFFRDPERRPDVDRAAFDADTVVSPADGKVMYAGPGQDGVAPEGEWQQVSIFLSAFDVHINRAPYGGRLREVTYKPGRWLAAYKHESAHQNERTDLVIEREVDGQVRAVHFRQIVGLMARRVVTRVAAGDELATGERIGLMKFGSRMDVFVPPEVDLTVRAGARVVAGETVIARWPSADAVS
ncbi:phosphatidylserine decarboxylase [Knoellia subterranea]|uniref:Phosphatidylserine decarboxylase proenzyme n=1 Tax=Knoellia subterranea KCTC 19937 TaxID=1385521 RepID=A0A0A0JPR0_9MICO|nr:phosphatidylserine decarboxylase [Knoellia subterranea]KGN38754.1 phosphatidylserine decarboxylase [Knoellia subterranea KCTC 19937]